jgi:hypothetical protein
VRLPGLRGLGVIEVEERRTAHGGYPRWEGTLPTAWTRPWGSDAAYRWVQNLAGNVRDLIQAYRPRKPSEGPVSPSERRFENTLMDEGRFTKKGGFLVDRSRLVRELPEHYPSGCRPVSLGPSAF